MPIFREVVVDSETPVSLYAQFRHQPYPFIFESAVGGEKWARYSFIGYGAQRLFRYQNGIATTFAGNVQLSSQTIDLPAALDAFWAPLRISATQLEAAIGTFPRFFGGAVGYLGYEAIYGLEAIQRQTAASQLLPEAQFTVPEVLLVVDNLKKTIRIVHHPITDNRTPAALYERACTLIDQTVEQLTRAQTSSLRPFTTWAGALPADHLQPHHDAQRYKKQVRMAKEYILSGDVFQVVLSERFSRPRGAIDAFQVYRALRATNPSPYMFHLEYPDFAITGASPEVLLRVAGERVIVRPIAGTRPRGVAEGEDGQLEAELRADPKEIAEHVMLIDLGRNDIGRVSEPGSVQVTDRMVIERYSHVMHLVSQVEGRLRKDRTGVDALCACFPAGTLTGAPKIRAMEIIEELESESRGIYGGVVGYLSSTGNLDMAIAIRTLLTLPDRFIAQAGAGIVADSDPEKEWQEVLNKLKTIEVALATASQISPQKA